MLNYAVDAALLEPSVPAGTELDAFEGNTYLSLVGFEFKSHVPIRASSAVSPGVRGSEPPVLREAVVQERCGVHSGTGSEIRRGGRRAIGVQRKLFVRAHVASNRYPRRRKRRGS